MGCDAAENNMFLEIHTGVSGWIVIWRSRPELQVITLFLTDAR